MKACKYFAVLLLAGIVPIASAQTNYVNGENGQGGEPSGGGRKGPPPQAIAACEGKASVTSRMI